MGEVSEKDLITVCVPCHRAIEHLTQLGFKNNPDFNAWDLLKMIAPDFERASDDPTLDDLRDAFFEAGVLQRAREKETA